MTTTTPTSKPGFRKFSRFRMVRRGEITLRGVTYHYAGGLEESLLKQLDEKLPPKEKIIYEPGNISYVPITPKRASYKPDILLPNDIIVEGKGQFTSKERRKFLAVKEAHPGLDIRFVFSNPNAKIGKKSETTYAIWCERNGFHYAKKIIPQEWIDEPSNMARTSAAADAIQ